MGCVLWILLLTVTSRMNTGEYVLKSHQTRVFYVRMKYNMHHNGNKTKHTGFMVSTCVVFLYILCNGLSDQSYMVDSLNYFSFQPVIQPVLHDWCNKGCGMRYPVCGMMHIKEPLLLIETIGPCGSGGFPLSLSDWSFTIKP